MPEETQPLSSAPENGRKRYNLKTLFSQFVKFGLVGVSNTAISLGIGELPYAPNQVMRLCADISSLTQETGFLPAVSFEEGIRRTIETMRKQSEL